MRPFVYLAIAWFAIPTLALAQQRPLTTEDPESIGAGNLELKVGAEYTPTASIPQYGIQGQLLKLPLVGINIGVSSIAEIQIDGGLFNHLKVTQRKRAPFSKMLTFSGDSTSSVEDVVVGAKMRVVAEGEVAPSFGFKFATRLPNASNESGLGMDTYDFLVLLLAGKTVGPVRIVANLGENIVSNPWIATSQTDVVVYRLSMTVAATPQLVLLGEILGQKFTGDITSPPPGTETKVVWKIGARYTWGGWTADAAFGYDSVHKQRQHTGTMGISYLFDAFTVP